MPLAVKIVSGLLLCFRVRIRHLLEEGVQLLRQIKLWKGNRRSVVEERSEGLGCEMEKQRVFVKETREGREGGKKDVRAGG